MAVRGTDVAALIREGMLRRSYPNAMANFRNIAKPWRKPPWDPWRRYAVPWAWGGLGIVVDGEAYAGEIDTAALIFEPPEELAGRIHVAPDRRAVVGLARRHLGLRPCAGGDASWDQLRALLTAARPQWRSVGYGLAAAMATEEFATALYWNEPARHRGGDRRQRQLPGRDAVAAGAAIRGRGRRLAHCLCRRRRLLPCHHAAAGVAAAPPAPPRSATARPAGRCRQGRTPCRRC